MSSTLIFIFTIQKIECSRNYLYARNYLDINDLACLYMEDLTYVAIVPKFDHI